MVDFTIHPAAQLEYECAAQWYADRSETAAERFVVAVEAGIEEIRKRPDSYSSIDDRHRLYIVRGFPYYVAYRYRDGLVEVVAIRHAARDQDEWKGR